MREHQKQHRHPRSTSMSAFPPHLHQFRQDLKQQAVPELHPDSPYPSAQQWSFQGHMEADGNGKMSSGRTYD